MGKLKKKVNGNWVDQSFKTVWQKKSGNWTKIAVGFDFRMYAINYTGNALACFNTDLQQVWQITLNVTTDFQVNNIVVDRVNNIYIIGGSINNYQKAIIKLDKDGNQIWLKNYYAQKIVLSPDGTRLFSIRNNSDINTYGSGQSCMAVTELNVNTGDIVQSVVQYHSYEAYFDGDTYSIGDKIYIPYCYYTSGGSRIQAIFILTISATLTYEVGRNNHIYLNNDEAGSYPVILGDTAYNRVYGIQYRDGYSSVTTFVTGTMNLTSSPKQLIADTYITLPIAYVNLSLTQDDNYVYVWGYSGNASISVTKIRKSDLTVISYTTQSVVAIALISTMNIKAIHVDTDGNVYTMSAPSYNGNTSSITKFNSSLAFVNVVALGKSTLLIGGTKLPTQ